MSGIDDLAFAASVAEPGWRAWEPLVQLLRAGALRGDRSRDAGGDDAGFGAQVAGLSATGRVDALVGLERLIGWAQAQQYRLMGAMLADPSGRGSTDPCEVDKRWAQEDVQAALGISSVAAAARLATAEQLTGRLTSTLDALEAGEASGDKARALTDAVALLDDEAARTVERTLLEQVSTLSLPGFRRRAATTVLAADPDAVRKQRAQGVADRRVWCRPDAPGIASFFASLPAEDAAALMTAVNHVAEGCDRDDPRTTDQRRADALTWLALDHLGLSDATHETAPDAAAEAASSAPAGRRPAVQVTVALSTLLGLDEQCAELEGHGAIPAGLAREIAADPSGTWRRLLTDERGVLVDYGRTVYRPPAALQRFVRARDRTCRFPGCAQPARRCELDHRRRWTDLGPTNEHNLDALSGRHHHAKDDHGWRPRRRADLTMEWTSPTGHHYAVPPSTYPVDRTSSVLTGADPPPY